MIMSFAMQQIKALFLCLLAAWRRALCCLRRRQRSPSFSSVPLTVVAVDSNRGTNGEMESWNWEDAPQVIAHSRPATVQDHIEMYRKQVAEKAAEPSQEDQQDFFENMAPKITRQKKIVIGNGGNGNAADSSRLSLAPNAVAGNDLGEWEDTGGWEEQTDDLDANEALREKRRQERERRAWEQQQRRQERARPVLGARIS